MQQTWQQINNMEYKISKQNRDALYKYIDDSALPHSDVKSLLQMLATLAEIKPVPDTPQS